MWFVVAIREKRAIGCRSALDIKMKWSFETVALSLRNIFACAIHTQIQLCVVCCGCLWWIKTIAMMNDVIERWNEKQHQSLYSRWFFFLLPASLRCQRYKFTQFSPAVKVVTTNNPIGWLSLSHPIPVDTADNFAISNELIVIAHADSWLSTLLHWCAVDVCRGNRQKIYM